MADIRMALSWARYKAIGALNNYVNRRKLYTEVIVCTEAMIYPFI